MPRTEGNGATVTRTATRPTHAPTSPTDTPHSPITAGDPNLQTPLTDLHAYHRNPRRGDVDAIATSLTAHGQYKPVTVNVGTHTGRPHEVLAGNHTVAAARQLGWSHVAAVWVDVDDDEARRIVLADNRTSDLASYSTPDLSGLLAELDGDYDGTGWTAESALDYLDPAAAAGVGGADATGYLTDPDDLPEEPPTPRTRTGDVWQLGVHRLICGDSTDASTFVALLDGQPVQMVWTDPPYGISYVGKTADALTIENDNLDLQQLSAFLDRAFAATLASTKPGAMWYVAAPHGPIGLAFSLALHKIDVWRHSLVWVKNSLVMGRADYHYRHEPLYYGWTPGAPRLHPVPDRKQDTIWEVDRPARNAEHPTMKPVELITRALLNSSKRGDLVLDPFGGSGSTLIAAQVTGRVARLIELSPVYCDVIARRYQEFTGDLPVLLRTGEQVDFTAQPLPQVS